MSPRRYVYVLVGIFLVLILGATVINAIAFHKRIFATSNIDENIQQALYLEAHPPKAVIIGTSRTSVFKELHTWPQDLEPVMVFSNRADPPECTLKRLHNIIYLSPGLQHVLLCPDFFVFNTHNHGYKNFCDVSYMHFPLPETPLKRAVYIGRFKLNRYLYFVFSVQNTWFNIQALWHLSLKNPIPTEFQDHSGMSSAEKFRCNEAFYLRDTLWPGARKHFDYRHPNSQRTTFDDFRETLELLYSKGIETTICLLPHHARIHEITVAAGLGEQYFEWLRAIVHINEAVAKAYGKTPYSIKDFAIHNEYTQEIVYDDLKKPMHYYNDSSHFSVAYAREIIHYLFGQKQETLPRHFCVDLKASTIESFIKQFRKDQVKFRQEQPEAVRCIQAVYDGWNSTQAAWYGRPLSHGAYWEAPSLTVDK